ncbi:MAG TPA: hemerythrin domain-containing protein [Candidatus Paceibacterota bacterium]|nr:hemerythrin domain-containing protein [Candidatus Paceibacterota bacterium]
MNPIDTITADHRVVEQLYLTYEALDEFSDMEKQALADAILESLDMHADMMEALVFPKLADAAIDSVEEARVTLAEVKVVVDELMGMMPDEPEFDSKMRELKDAFDRHSAAEEGTFLPQLARSLGEGQLHEIGAALKDFKDAHTEVEEDGEAEEF